MILLINFLRLSKEVERQGKNNGASGHALQLQEKIYEKPIQFCVLFYETTISTGDVFTRSRFVTVSFNFGSFSPTEIISHAQ